MPANTPLDEKIASTYPYSPSSYETIDMALYNFLNEDLNIYCDTNGGFKKVPVIFSIGERAYQMKDKPSLRPNDKTLEYPLISIVKNSINQNPQNKSIYGVYVPPYFDYYGRGGSIDIKRVVNQDKTKNFANANAIRSSDTKKDKNYQTWPGENKNIVYETYSIPQPAYVEVDYTISVISNYQQQMNEITQPFNSFSSTPNVFKVNDSGHYFDAFVRPEFSLENNSSGLETAERLFKTNITIMVLGYLVGSDKNQETPFLVRRQSAAKLRIQRERVVLGDKPQYHPDLKNKYRP